MLIIRYQFYRALFTSYSKYNWPEVQNTFKIIFQKLLINSLKVAFSENMINNNAVHKFSEQSTPATSLKLSSSAPVAFI